MNTKIIGLFFAAITGAFVISMVITAVLIATNIITFTGQ